MNAWKSENPPKNGQTIIAIGRIIGRDDISTFVQPFCAEIFWQKDSSGYEGWHCHRGGLVVAEALEDEVMIDHWIEPPLDQNSSQPSRDQKSGGAR